MPKPPLTLSGKMHAIVTGDLIGSSAADPARIEATMDRLQSLSLRLGPKTRFTRYRGDGWQIYISNPGDGLHDMLWLQAELIAEGLLKSRMALGLGETYGGSESSLTTGGGPAFIASGRALDAMTRGRLIALADRLTLDGASHRLDPLHLCLIDMIDAAVSRWTNEQAEAMAARLAPEGGATQQAISDALGISRQAVASRLKAADEQQIMRAAHAFWVGYGTQETLNA